MSDKYFNAYVDSAVGVIHEYVASTLQLKAQLRIANELLAEKDAKIAAITSEAETLRTQIDSFYNQVSEAENLKNVQNDEIQNLKNVSSNWENQYNAVLQRVSHMETLTNQYNELKVLYKEKLEQLNEANQKIDSLLKPPKIEVQTPLVAPKKSINTKNAPRVETEVRSKQVADDF